MKRLSTLMSLSVVLLLQAVFCASALAAQYGDVTVAERAVPRPARHMHGYAEYRFAIFNDSPAAQRTVQLVVPGTSWNESGRVSRTVTLLPKTQSLVSMWQPPVPVSGQGLRVYIDGRPMEETLNVEIPPTFTQNTSGLYTENVLFSQGVDSRFRDSLGVLKEQALASGGSWTSGVKNEYGQRTTVPVSQWSESWLGYSSFDGLVMMQNEWRTLPGRVRDAICSWVETGGSLLIVGELDIPARWEDRMAKWRFNAVTPIKYSRVHHGLVAKVDADRLIDWNEAAFKDTHAILWDKRSTIAAVPMDISEANTTFPVTDSLGVPARGMLAIMLLFAILIGPVNMIIFAKLNKRLWTLITIPAAAVLFSACVFAYTMLADGVSAVGRSQSMTILDQKNHQATTVGWLGYYAPLRPSDGLHFDLDTELSPQIGDITHNTRGNEVTARYTNWTTDQHLITGWVSSRIPAHFTFRKSQSRRERLQVTQDAQGNITVVNGLGSDILSLHLVDDKGNLHTADGPITAGQQARLVKENNKPDKQRGMFDVTSMMVNWRIRPGNLDIDGREIWKPNTYIAKLKHDVFVEQGLSRLKSFQSQSAVNGLFEMNSKEDE